MGTCDSPVGSPIRDDEDDGAARAAVAAAACPSPVGSPIRDDGDDGAARAAAAAAACPSPVGSPIRAEGEEAAPSDAPRADLCHAHVWGFCRRTDCPRRHVELPWARDAGAASRRAWIWAPDARGLWACYPCALAADR